jgi:hypothetical protein
MKNELQNPKETQATYSAFTYRTNCRSLVERTGIICQRSTHTKSCSRFFYFFCSFLFTFFILWGWKEREGWGEEFIGSFSFDVFQFLFKSTSSIYFIVHSLFYVLLLVVILFSNVKNVRVSKKFMFFKEIIF